MRAEIQNIVAEIENSLTLLAQRLDWETAEFRLDGGRGQNLTRALKTRTCGMTLQRHRN